MTIKQIIPQEFCLTCRNCCRFKEDNSAWLPCLLEEEILELLDKDGIPSVYLTLDKKIKPIPNPNKEGFICAFLNPENNKCRAYQLRPFECQLYPFLINLRNNKVLLSLDLNCPYVERNINTPEFQDYIKYLTAFLNEPAQLQILKDNPQLIQAYEEVAKIVELDISHEQGKGK